MFKNKHNCKNEKCFDQDCGQTFPSNFANMIHAYYKHIICFLCAKKGLTKIYFRTNEILKQHLVHCHGRPKNIKLTIKCDENTEFVPLDGIAMDGSVFESLDSPSTSYSVAQEDHFVEDLWLEGFEDSNSKGNLKNLNYLKKNINFIDFLGPIL